MVKLLLKRIKPLVNDHIPQHQFGFREKHSTIEQIHRIVNRINLALEKKRYCSTVFLDINQAFDRVWHPGLLYKIKRILPQLYYLLLKSYLEERCFEVKFQDSISELKPIRASVPQGSILGPLLYIIFTAVFPTHPKVNISTFADDTALLATNTDPKIASKNIQKTLKKWKNS